MRMSSGAVGLKAETALRIVELRRRNPDVHQHGGDAVDSFSLGHAHQIAETSARHVHARVLGGQPLRCRNPLRGLGQ